MTNWLCSAKRCSKTIMTALLFVAVVDSAKASVEISASPTRHMRCVGGICSPTDKIAKLNVTDLTNMLATSDVKVTTGHGAVTITVSAPFTWTSSSRLTLDANLNVSFRAQVEVAGTGGLTIITNDGGTGGDIFFFKGGSVDFWDTTSSLIINGNSYALIDTLPALIDVVKANPTGNYALTKSYNAGKTRVYKTSPINSFSGTFEGLGHTISNLAINFKSNKRKLPTTALFAVSTGSIRDIGLLKANVISDGSAAILVGENDGTIVGAYVAGGTVTAGTRNSTIAAGLAAVNNNGTIKGCHSITTVANGQLAEFTTLAGLVGENEGTITNSYSSGTIAGAYGGVSGGLVGENYGDIELSHSASELIPGFTGEASRAGGLVGINGKTISQSYADGSLSEGGGGLVGDNSGAVTQSYAIGPVAADIAGGLVENNEGTISQSYSTGSVAASYGYNWQGGFVGLDQSQYGSKISASYWDTDTSGVTDLSKGAGNVPYDEGISGLSSAQLSSGLPPGFDPNVWAENPAINNGLPYLIANPPMQNPARKKKKG